MVVRGGGRNKVVCGVDIGYTHLSIVRISCTQGWRFLRVLAGKLIDLEAFRAAGEVVQRALAAIAAHKALFRGAATVVVERQPLNGFQSVFAAFPVRFGRKCVFVSPVKVHRRFDTGHLDYDERKKRMQVKLGLHLMRSEDYRRATRKHDFCDALGVALIHLGSLREKARHERDAALLEEVRRKQAAQRAARRAEWLAAGAGDIETIERYRYTVGL